MIAQSQANSARDEAIRAIREAQSASAEASRARSEANQARVEANFATEAANRASAKADQSIVKSNTATAQANEAIKTSSANAQELVSLRSEVAQLKREQASLNIGNAVLKAAVKTVGSQVNEKEDKYIVRRVEAATITNASGIRDLNGSFVGLDSKIGKTVSEFGTSITQTFDKKLADTTKDIRDGIGLGGINLEGIKAKVFDDLFGNTKANSRLDEAINTEVTTQTKAQEKVNKEQYTDLKKQVTDMPVVLGGILAGTMVTTLKPLTTAVNQTVAQTKPAVLTQAASAGVCNSTKPGGCANNNLGNLFNQNASNLIDAGAAAFAAANNALLQRMSGVLNTVKTTTDTIKKSAQATEEVVTHGKYGLQAMQNFADTAWKATRADKVLQVVNTTLLVHNAMMLSNNLFSTMGEATNMALQAIGVKDHEGQEINVNSIVQSKIRAMLTSVLGAENYKALTARIAKANRIYQSGINILDATRNMFDATHSIAEVTVRHTGEIGNALRNAGVVYENAYEEMVEKVNPQSKRLMGLEKFTNGIEVAEEAFDSVSQVSGSVLEIQQNVTEIKTEKTALIKEMDDDKRIRQINELKLKLILQLPQNLIKLTLKRLHLRRVKQWLVMTSK